MQLSDWLAQPPVMAGYGGGAQPLSPQQQWLMRHPQFGGQQGNTDPAPVPYSGYGQPAPQAFQNASPQGLQNGAAFQPNLGQANPFAAIFSGMNGHPNLAAWRDRRMAAGLPYRGNHMHNPFNVQPTEA